jgi:dienelactone hydrolase
MNAFTRLMRRILLVLALCAWASLASTASDAHLERKMTTGAIPNVIPRNLNTYHLFQPPATRKEWEVRVRSLRRQILFSAGLWPMPPKTPLHPRITGRVEAADFIVENVAIETFPGFYLCGNLYRPKGKKGKHPAIVNPHGHWANGRLEMEEDVPLAEPPPKEPAPGRANLTAIGVNLARQGFVVFAYDMVGYNDTKQISHGFAGNLRAWLWNISLMGLQLWNSIRVVDYLESLPDVDKRRIGATGASGGGTQTFLLCAVDPRIKAAVPVNMISAHMQGGCLCENGPGLRLGTDNVEIGAMMAPRPLLLICATGDWTKHNPTEEWPAIKKVYDLYGAGGKTAVKQFNYGHNYNIESREAMYAWFGRWLMNDPHPQHFREKPFALDPHSLRVWNEQNPLPSHALDEPALIRYLQDMAEKQLAALWPKDERSLRTFRKFMAPMLALSLGVHTPRPTKTAARDQTGHHRTFSNTPNLLIVTVKGDEAASHLLERLKALLTHRNCPFRWLELDPIQMGPEQLWQDFFTTYNRTPLGDRVQRILDELEALGASHRARRALRVVGLGKAGLWTLLARALSSVEGPLVAEVARFAREEDQAYIADLYAPGLRRVGDVQTAALLVAPGPLALFHSGPNFKTEIIEAGYEALNAAWKVVPGAMTAEDIAGWLSIQ